MNEGRLTGRKGDLRTRRRHSPLDTRYRTFCRRNAFWRFNNRFRSFRARGKPFAPHFGLKLRISLTARGDSSKRGHMSTRSQEELERFAEVFKALSNANRLAIFLRLVSRCPPGTSCRFDAEIRECVGDVGQDLGISRTTVSHHVKELRRAGLLRVERVGRNVECRLDGETVLFLADLLTGRLPPEAERPLVAQGSGEDGNLGGSHRCSPKESR